MSDQDGKDFERATPKPKGPLPFEQELLGRE